MNTQSQQILRSALALPESDRAEIAATLIHSLDTATDEGADAAWAAEIQRRIESMDSGEVKPIYRFGEGVVDGEDLTLTDTEIRVPGFGQGVRLDLANPWEELTGD